MPLRSVSRNAGPCHDLVLFDGAGETPMAPMVSPYLISEMPQKLP